MSNDGPDATAKEVAQARSVEVAFLEGVRKRLPNYPAVVETLGCLYTEMGRYQDGLDADRQMVQLEPCSSTAWYNLACSLSLTKQPTPAFDALEKAVALGYDDAEWMNDDDDLIPIRDDPRFAKVLAKLHARNP